MTTDGVSVSSRLQPFTLGDWLVDPRACLASRGDASVKLRPQLLDVLVCLARRAGEIVLKDELLAEVWPGQYIADSGLSRCIAELRQVLGDDVQQPRYIETIPKRGYRVIAPVVWVTPPSATAQEPAPGESPAAAERAAPETGNRAAEAAASARPSRERPGRRWLWAAAALLFVAAAAAAVWFAGRVPAKVLSERDPVVLAFENRTGEAVFDDTLPLAVSIELEQSPYLALLSPARVHEVLGMMKRPADTAVTRAVGLELCERAGSRALIVTSIARLGAQYVIGMEAVACSGGGVLARQQTAAGRKEEVLAALRRAAGQIRLAVGESADSLERHQLPLVEATTVSLEALRALRRGDAANERGDAEAALTLYRDAVALDPGFAVAQSRLGLAATGTERLEALRKAYALRSGVTAPERLEIEAAYYRGVTFERPRVIEALEMLTRSYPNRARARRGLANEYMDTGRYEAALTEAVEALRLEPDSALNFAVVVRAHLFLNQIPEARQAAERAIALGGTGSDLHVALFFCAIWSNDQALLARERAWLEAHLPETSSWLEDEAEEALSAGRLEDAIGFLERLSALAPASVAAPRQVSSGDLLQSRQRYRLRMARYEALCGFGDRAVRRVDAEIGPGMSAAARIDAVRAVASAGRFDVAERLLDDLDREGQSGDWSATMARTYRAAIVANRGRPGEALDLLAPLRSYELGFAYSLEPLFVRAQTHYLAGDWSSARAAFADILAHSTIDSARKIQPIAQLWLARTLARAGDVAGSRRAYEQLFDRWRAADPDLPVLQQARREHAELPR